MDTTIPPKSSCLRVFDIPELSRLIVHGFLTTKDQAILLRICRQFFENIRPFVWEFIINPVVVILLIPGSDVTPRDGFRILNSIRTVSPFIRENKICQRHPILSKITSFPKRLDLSRFNLYAPYIRTLTLPDFFQADDNNHWNEFLTQARTLNLLPSLEQIFMFRNAPGRQQLGRESIDLLAAFLSPSMSTLGFRWRHQEYFGFEHFDDLLEVIVEKCPKLESFTAYPGDRDLADQASLDDVDATNLDAETPIEAIDPHMSKLPGVPLSNPRVRTPYLLSQFTCLRSITTTGFILEHESFIVLSQLPRLETLSVECDSYNNPRIYGTELRLPLPAFPALRSFIFTQALHSTVINLCSLQVFVKSLDVLRVNCYTFRDNPSADPEPVNIIDILTPIATFSSSIAKLTLTQHCVWIIPPAAIQLLKRLPLVNLYLGHIDYRTFDLENLVRTLPKLEELRLSSFSRSCPVKHLRTIATHLPALRHLSLLIRFDSIHDIAREDLEPLHSKGPPTMYFESDFCPGRRQSATSKRLAAYLYALWPNVTCVQYGAIGPTDFSERFEGGMFWDDPAWEEESELDNIETISRTLDELRTKFKEA